MIWKEAKTEASVGTLLGTKRTFCSPILMSAFDPKRTCMPFWQALLSHSQNPSRIQACGPLGWDDAGNEPDESCKSDCHNTPQPAELDRPTESSRQHVRYAVTQKQS